MISLKKLNCPRSSALLEVFFFRSAESHLEYTRAELVNVSWYNLLHWDSIRTAYCKHQTGNCEESSR